MTAAALQFLFGGTGVPFSANSGIRGYNTALAGAYSGTYPFLDFMKVSLWYSGSSTADGVATADQWVSGIPDGHHYDFPICYSMGNESGYFPPGDYEAVSSNTNLTVSVVASSGITSVVPGAGTCTFTTTDLTGSWSGFALTIRVTNSSGVPQDCLDLRVNLVSKRDALLAGAIFDPAYVAAYAGAKSLRMHAFAHFDSASGSTWMRYFSDFNQTLTKRSYCGDNGVSPSGVRNGNMPVKVMCQFADEVGARPWFNMNTGMGQMLYVFDHSINGFRVYGQNAENATSTNIAHRLVDGEVLRSYSFRDNPALLPDLGNDQDMYVINATLDSGKAFQLSTTLGGSPASLSNAAATHSITITVTAGSHTVTAISSMTDIAVGSIIRCANLAGGFGIITSIVSSTAVVDLINANNDASGNITGSSLAATVNGDLGPAELAFSVIASMDVDLENDMIRPYMQEIKDYMDVHPTMPAPMFEPSNEIWNFGFPSFRWFQKIAAIFATGAPGDTAGAVGWFMLKMWNCAEDIFGAGNFTIIHPGQGAAFGNLAGSFEYVDPGLRNTGQKVKAQYVAALAGDSGDIPTVVYAFATYLGYAESEVPESLPTVGDPEVIDAAYTNNGNSTAIPDSYWDTRFNNEIAWKVLTVPGDMAAIEGKVPGIQITLYEWGQQIQSGNILDSNRYAIALNLLSYLDRSTGAAMYDRYWQQVVVPYIDRWYTLNHYSGIGGRAVTNQFIAYPIGDSRLNETLCARAGWYKLQ